MSDVHVSVQDTFNMMGKEYTFRIGKDTIYIESDSEFLSVPLHAWHYLDLKVKSVKNDYYDAKNKLGQV